jgi:predicted porin
VSLPIIWGPSYASGAALFGGIGKFDYAVEMKNAALSSRPEVWDAAQTQWQHPTFSGRLGYRPDVSWNLGFSASTGSYLQPLAAPTLAAGYNLDDYRETVLGQDLGFAWHHFQFWSEVYRARFEIPRVGFADTTAYYLEAKLKFTPQFFGALRWNQQLFGTVRDSNGSPVPWGRDVWRIDLGFGYRFTPHTQFKVQYSWQHEDADLHRFPGHGGGPVYGAVLNPRGPPAAGP